MSEEKMQKYGGWKVRSVWDDVREEWWFSVVDVVGVLTEQPDIRHAAKYWSVLKTRLKEEGSELTTNCSQLKMTSADGKKYKTDAMTVEQILRLVQSIPSKKVEPFKIWLAKVGNERINETIDPELAMARATETYLKKGYSEEWIKQRLMSIKVRNDLTNEWRNRGVKKGKEYAVLTDEISKAWSGMTTIETRTGKKVITSDNAERLNPMKDLIEGLIEGDLGNE